MKILVTGGNTGIGFALCRQLAVDHSCHVYLTARNEQKGTEAVSKIQAMLDNSNNKKGFVEFLPLDTSDDQSVLSAAEAIKDKLSNDGANGGSKLYGLVNNAGIGLNTALSGPEVVNTNLYGPKRMCDAFGDLIQDNGRIVNLGSGSGPMYVSSVSSPQDKKMLCNHESVTWNDFIEPHSKQSADGMTAYGLSKALLACYTGYYARCHSRIISSCVSPGFIDTQMTAGWGASKSPEDATLSIKKCLFDDLVDGSGWYYGSDGLRSPYHFLRNPGEPVYDGQNPFA